MNFVWIDSNLQTDIRVLHPADDILHPGDLGIAAEEGGRRCGGGGGSTAAVLTAGVLHPGLRLLGRTNAALTVGAGQAW